MKNIKKSLLFVALIGSFSLAIAKNSDHKSNALQAEKDQSYALGYKLGENVHHYNMDTKAKYGIKTDVFISEDMLSGFKDGLYANNPKLNQAQMTASMEAFSSYYQSLANDKKSS